jgi:hypothetical protein
MVCTSHLQGLGVLDAWSAHNFPNRAKRFSEQQFPFFIWLLRIIGFNLQVMWSWRWVDQTTQTILPKWASWIFELSLDGPQSDAGNKTLQRCTTSNKWSSSTHFPINYFAWPLYTSVWLSLSCSQIVNAESRTTKSYQLVETNNASDNMRTIDVWGLDSKFWCTGCTRWEDFSIFYHYRFQSCNCYRTATRIHNLLNKFKQGSPDIDLAQNTTNSYDNSLSWPKRYLRNLVTLTNKSIIWQVIS